MKSIKAETRAFRQTGLTESSTGHVEARKSKIAPCPAEWVQGDTWNLEKLHSNDEQNWFARKNADGFVTNEIITGLSF